MYQQLDKSQSSIFRNALTAVLCAALSACGGDGGGNVGFADGQNPDPVVIDVPIAYVKRPLPVDEDSVLSSDDRREPVTFNAGADLYVRERASPTALETNVTFEITNGEGDVKGLQVNAEATKLVFALREPMLEDVDEEDQPTWNIWQYDLETATLSRIITSDINAEAGQDISPAFLPDGRIVFASDRQRKSKAILLDEGKPQYSALDENENVESFVLHVMNDDGTDIRQITFNQSHDLYPMVRNDGRIVFSRWGAKGGNNTFSLYQSLPDGVGVELLYGANSTNTGTDGTSVHFFKPTEMPDGRIAVLLQPFEAARLGGQISLIDTATFLENEQPIAAQGGAIGPAQNVATANDVRTDNLPSLGGRYSSFYPLWDGTDRLFVSWSQCRLQIEDRILPCTDDNLADPLAVEADPLYGIWAYDASDDTQLPIVAPEEGFMYTDIIAAQPRDLPQIIFDQAPGVELDAEMFEAGVGVLNIKSVYDINGVDSTEVGITALADPAQFTAAERPARFLRVIKGVSLPDPDLVEVPASAFGRSRNQGLREIVGYAPIEPDGSVQVRVPADVALSISVLNGEGKRTSRRHEAWLTVRPGETVTCHGCHDPSGGLSHGRSEAFQSINLGAVTTGLPFPNTEAALFADFGETMAETRARISCATDCASLQPSVDIIYDDVWTDEVAAGRAKDASIAWQYADLETPQPVSVACATTWSALCRTVIKYEEHIHPMWSLPRITFAFDGVTVVRDNTCTSCHSPIDEMAVTRVPAGQLDLSDGPSVDDPDQFNSYRELIFNDTEQELVMGALQDRFIEIGINPDTMEPIIIPVRVPRAMIANSARASLRFFSIFEPARSHARYMSAAELKLVAEWLDVGAQYNNDPFAAAQD